MATGTKAATETGVKTDAETALKDFLKAYETARGKTGFADWVARYGNNTDRVYTEAVTDAYRTFDRGEPTYGAGGESRGRAGLTESGYSAYLAEKNASRLADGKSAAVTAASDAAAENSTGYAAYVKGRASAAKAAARYLQTRSVTGFDEAYAYALTAGLDEANARLTATLVGQMKNKAVSTSAVRQRISILNHMVSLNLPRDAAYTYALSCGVGEETAAELADAAVIAEEEQYGNRTIQY